MKELFRNKFFIGYSALYILTLMLMAWIEHFPISQAIAVLLIVGVFFTLIAYFTSKSSTPLFESKPIQLREAFVIVTLLVYITLMLSFGFDFIKTFLFQYFIKSSKSEEIIGLINKLFFFVFIPFLVYKVLYKFNLRDFGLDVKVKEFFTRKNITILITMFSGLFLFQFFLGNGAGPIRDGLITKRQLLIGLPLLYIWLVLEVGLVEEFFFRALIQSRISAITKSELGGIFLSGLFFGLAHAPGFYLRGSGTLDSLGQHPGLFMSIGYSILVLSVAGFFLSTIWAKTRNLWLVITIHAFVDLLPGLTEFVQTWNIN
jgi:membrane protease YdiL (CAAX protease family)